MSINRSFGGLIEEHIKPREHLQIMPSLNYPSIMSNHSWVPANLWFNAWSMLADNVCQMTFCLSMHANDLGSQFNVQMMPCRFKVMFRPPQIKVECHVEEREWSILVKSPPMGLRVSQPKWWARGSTLAMIALECRNIASLKWSLVATTFSGWNKSCCGEIILLILLSLILLVW